MVNLSVRFCQNNMQNSELYFVWNEVVAGKYSEWGLQLFEAPGFSN